MYFIFDIEMNLDLWVRILPLQDFWTADWLLLVEKLLLEVLLFTSHVKVVVIVSLKGKVVC